jgi:F-type H+-transporting ATPase subunit b
MPQLDFANPLTIAQVVWMFIIFAVLYVALRFWALPQVGGVLAEREHRISSDLDSARRAKEEADRAAAEIAERGRSASAEAQAQVAKASDAAKREAAEQARADSEHLDRQLAEAEQRIAAARKDAMGALRQVASDTATAVLSRLTGHAPDPARVDAAVGDILSRSGAQMGAVAARS